MIGLIDVDNAFLRVRGLVRRLQFFRLPERGLGGWLRAFRESNRWLAQTISQATSTAVFKLPECALPVPAKSNAVPWSTDVRINGKPSVMFTPPPKLACFSTGKPWS